MNLDKYLKIGNIINAACIGFCFGLVVAGCSTPGVTSKSVGTILTPTQLQADAQFAGSQVVSVVSVQAKATIHQIATDLVAISADNATTANLTQLVSQLRVTVPTQYQSGYTLAVDAIAAGLNAATTSFGDHNPQVVAYAQAVGNGLLAAGF